MRLILAAASALAVALAAYSAGQRDALLKFERITATPGRGPAAKTCRAECYLGITSGQLSCLELDGGPCLWTQE